MNETINLENGEKNQLNKLNFTKKDHLPFMQFWMKWV